MLLEQPWAGLDKQERCVSCYLSQGYRTGNHAEHIPRAGAHTPSSERGEHRYPWLIAAGGSFKDSYPVVDDGGTDGGIRVVDSNLCASQPTSGSKTLILARQNSAVDK